MRLADTLCLVSAKIERATDLAKFHIAAPNLCDHYWLGLCFIRPPAQPLPLIFGFAVFVTALTLMSVVFTISDTRFRFRIAVAPLPLYAISYWTTVFVGLVSLGSDVIFSLRWPIPVFLANDVLWQAAAGLLFFVLVLLWMYFGILKPALFGPSNARNFVATLYRIILKGDPAEMAVIGYELGRSAKSIIETVTEPQRGKTNPWSQPRTLSVKDGAPKNPTTRDHANALLLLIGSRRFCKEVVATAPGTVIEFFEEMRKQRQYPESARQFAVNIAAAAIANKQSLLYHEDDGFSSGALGYWKPFSVAVFGNWALVEALGRHFGSPLDVRYDPGRDWDSEQLTVYTRAVLVTLKNYLDTGSWRYQSSVFERALETIEGMLSEIYKLNDRPADAWNSEAYEKLRVAVNFLSDAVDLVGKTEPFPEPIWLRSKRNFVHSRDLYDQLADFGYNLVEQASHVRRPTDLAWAIQHNAVWTRIMGTYSEDRAWPIVQFKIRRRIFNEVTGSRLLNYQSARVLGMALNVLGFKPWTGQSSADKRLQKALLAWTKKNYLRLWNQNPEVAESGLPAGLVFEPQQKRFVKTYAKGLEREAPKDFFSVCD